MTGNAIRKGWIILGFLFCAPLFSAPKPKAILGISIIGNKESPRVLTIVPWRQPLSNGEDPEVVQIWNPNLGLLDPDAFRRDIDLFLNQRAQRTKSNMAQEANDEK